MVYSQSRRKFLRSIRSLYNLYFAYQGVRIADRAFNVFPGISGIFLSQPDDRYEAINHKTPDFQFHNGDVVLELSKRPNNLLKMAYIHSVVVIGEGPNQFYAEHYVDEVNRGQMSHLDDLLHERPSGFTVLRTSSAKPDEKSMKSYFDKADAKEPFFDLSAVFFGIGPETFKLFRKPDEVPGLTTCIGFVQRTLYAGGLDTIKTYLFRANTPDDMINCPVYRVKPLLS